MFPKYLDISLRQPQPYGAQRRISLANCIRKESGGLGRNKSGGIGRVPVESLRADAYMYNTTLRNEKDVKFDVRART